MELAEDTTESSLTVQSQCIQYIDDLIAGLYFGPVGQAFDVSVTGITITPFKERFQDTVAGATASIEIEVTNPLNDCITPFN